MPINQRLMYSHVKKPQPLIKSNNRKKTVKCIVIPTAPDEFDHMAAKSTKTITMVNDKSDKFDELASYYVNQGGSMVL